ncbi:putative dual specificity protein phosphatase [Leishmania infantum JPCM5]|uniref:Dual_specificity_protein_phosphatase_-_putative n=2 Tax=Leishmania infantum TaxID=5671 RepID=A0A6L0XH54_LEIIN|nr:putative dual specificity protein phosphatase [Leishmania infantum JPCM5]CAC9500623.1 dual_specificity_protein_phosphatase_-_putative [Leishmania infantum]CAM69170.1 putative dual specificity protein phosphatase [Leishmania infantum JPCM5]SUZ43121.1 dual_specificity_protein_phosphatase_-_putative [Leishmania infantum]|eukprot:XP_001466450.1 putative dual specificity protein phosphatase [Leishmania infantum JPCM5]
MPPKVSELPQQRKNTVHHLPDDDISLFFRVLRFLSAHSHLATLDAATERLDDADRSPSTTPSAPVARRGVQCTQTGTSASVNNRIPTPPVLREPLEEFRMMATNLPIDQEGLEAARKTVCELLEGLCHKLADPAITKELRQKVLLTDGSELLGNSSSSSGALGISAVECGAIRSLSSFGIDSLNQMQEIVPGLWCGSYHPAIDRELMKRHGITHVCCCIGTPPSFPGDFIYMTLSADDRPDYDMTPHFAHTFEFIENALVTNHGGVLVHCGAGISRAPTVVSAYLMRKLRLCSSAAIHLVQQHRPCASPNTGFRQQLYEYGMKIGVREQEPAARRELASESAWRAANALRRP